MILCNCLDLLEKTSESYPNIYYDIPSSGQIYEVMVEKKLCNTVTLSMCPQNHTIATSKLPSHITPYHELQAKRF